MSDSARVIAQPTKTSRVLWDADDHVAERLREIKNMMNLMQIRLEWGDIPGATRAAVAAKQLCNQALDLRAERGRK